MACSNALEMPFQVPLSQFSSLEVRIFDCKNRVHFQQIFLWFEQFVNMRNTVGINIWIIHTAKRLAYIEMWTRFSEAPSQISFCQQDLHHLGKQWKLQQWRTGFRGELCRRSGWQLLALNPGGHEYPCETWGDTVEGIFVENDVMYYAVGISATGAAVVMAVLEFLKLPACFAWFMELFLIAGAVVWWMYHSYGSLQGLSQLFGHPDAVCRGGWWVRWRFFETQWLT